MRRLLVLVTVLLLAAPGQAEARTPEGSLTGVAQVSAGAVHSCARVTGGRVRCWGSDFSGQSGDGTDGGANQVPVTVVGTNGSGQLTGVTSIAAGTSTTCALLTSKQVRCWGRNQNGALGNGTSVAQSARPVVVKAVTGNGPLQNVTQLAGGFGHFCARLTNGQAVCWGNNEYRQLGDGTNTSRSRPVRVRPVLGSNQPALTNVKQVAVGAIHSCFVLTNGQARCVGNNSGGNLGDGTMTERSLPVAVRKPTGAGNLAGITSLTAGSQHTCALLTSRQVRCWGSNFTGQVGDNTNVMRLRPVTVRNVGGAGALGTVTQLDAGNYQTCARRSNGTAVCWGQNGFGQGGNGTTASPALAPVPVSASGIAQITAGEQHGCVRLSSGGAACYGNNDFAQLGRGTVGGSPLPTPAPVAT
jgi:alpha-tubulin suppressor-like RCC1 family protein